MSNKLHKELHCLACRVCGVAVCLRVFQRLSFISAQRMTKMRAEVMADVQSNLMLVASKEDYSSSSCAVQHDSNRHRTVQTDIRTFFKPVL
jgi:hypothetical protein